MNNSFTNKNFDNLKTLNLNWASVQLEMKNKLGLEIYESWLKKINFLEEFNNYILLSVPTADPTSLISAPVASHSEEIELIELIL